MAANRYRDNPPGTAIAAPSDRERWNARHRHAQLADRHPHAWLVDHGDLLTAHAGGRALDVACGLGREAAYLASVGLTVDALDVSDVAIARLHEHATQRALPIHATRMDLEHPQARFPRPPYDVICCFYFLHRPLLAHLAAALAPGGLLLYETLTRGHAQRAGSPIPQRFLLDPNELLHAFLALRVLHYREMTIDTPRPRAVASLVARREGRRAREATAQPRVARPPSVCKADTRETIEQLVWRSVRARDRR